ncbi:MAG: hypothetical protein ABIG92_05170 [Candidatus Omnitrophota bacterium]
MTAYKKYFIFGLILGILCVFYGPDLAYGRDKDEWLGGDKALHCGVSFALETVGYNIYKKNTSLDDSEARIASFTSTLFIGFVKEFLDRRFSWKDIGADAIGAGAGAALSLEF